ncbi:uncharacterized protein LOC125229386 isoform X1 [Leguminivora glycinivorella]|uniref:uncharacterized protein LOC125229386 isoform X1 n=1 Tax=Leguminivora glycinivorella TaxID=1035111 RepID=UPI00200D3D22|nr:uncharacterized protein LOC125229386 isoform X1 [Leguminivora glycinivorella]
MGSRWTHALPLCCLLGFIFVDTMTVSADVTATHANGASPLQASQIRRIQPHKENIYRIDMKTGSFEVVDDNNDTALTQRQDTASPNTGPAKSRSQSSKDHAPALDNILPRHWRTPQESQDPSASSRKRRNTPELSTGSWTVFSGNKTATVTSFSGLQDQIRKNVKNN